MDTETLAPEGTTTGRVGPADILVTRDSYAPLEAGDEALRAAVAQTELPPLLAALAVLLDEPALIAPELRPPSPMMLASLTPHGGMSEAAVALGRERALAALRRYRDAGSPRPESFDAALVERALAFLTRDASGATGEMLREQLGLLTPDHPMRAPAPRPRRAQPMRVAVIGAGVSGIATAYRLLRQGFEVEVFERSDGAGGVWHKNRYPGCRLDTPNFAYSFTFAQKNDWPQRFSKREEIEAYMATVIERIGLGDRIRFDTEVCALSYDAARAGWTVRFRTGGGAEQSLAVDAVISATGQLDRPNIPDFPGRETFAGRITHSAEYAADFDVEGRDVAVVGTGASAYQIVPNIADRVRSLTVFQRNPPWMLATPGYLAEIPEGMAMLLRQVPEFGRWNRFWQMWLSVEGRLPLTEVEPGWQDAASVGRLNHALREACLGDLRRQFADRPDLLEKMTPSYPPGSKRLLRDGGQWAEVLKRETVALQTSGIERLEPGGIVARDGSFHAADRIILATGFHASDYLAPIRVRGRDGRDLHDFWQGDCRGYLGISVPGFPNLFIIAGPNSGLVVNGNAVFTAECGAHYAVDALCQLRERGARAMEVRPERYAAFNEAVDAGNLRRAWGVATVPTWYQNSTGRASQVWPFGLAEYWSRTRRADLDDYTLTD